jgi:hypothetical protein
MFIGWSNQHQKHKSGRGPSSEHFWQVWLISVQRFQRRRFKCEKLTDGRTDRRRTLTHPLVSAKIRSFFFNFQLTDKFFLGFYFHLTGKAYRQLMLPSLN